jgi:uncharacterized protein YutE (UPF0331/DUF86 family)
LGIEVLKNKLKLKQSIEELSSLQELDLSNNQLKSIPSEIGKLSSLQEETFLDGDNPAIAESYIRRSLEAIFDIGRHVIARTAGKGIVEYKEVANALGIAGVVTKDLSERLKLMAGYRNRLIHFYHEITDKELFFIVRNNLTDMEAFVEEIKVFIEKYREQRQI